MTAEELAKWLHDTYERLAPQYGYETRQDTRQLDLASPNGQLMVAVARELIGQFNCSVGSHYRHREDNPLSSDYTPRRVGD